MEGVPPTKSNSNDICATPRFTLFSVTRTKLAVDMWKKSTMGNNRFNHSSSVL